MNETPREDASGERRRHPWLRGIALGALALVLAVLAFGGWVVATPGGTAWALRRADAAVPALAIGGSAGSFARGLVVRDLRWAAPEGGPVVALAEARARVRLGALLRGTVHVEDAALDGLRVRLRPSPEKPEEEQPFTLDPPVDVIVQRFVATDAVVVQEDGTPLARVQRAEFAGRWTAAGIRVDTLDVRAREGTARLQAQVRRGSPYDVRADGAVNWQFGERTVAATLAANTRGTRTYLSAHLTRPVVGRVWGTVQQSGDYPWRANVHLPGFDPRRELLPDSTLQSLAAELNGSGTRDSAVLAGVVVVNEQAIRLREFRGRLEEETLHLDALRVKLNDDPGELAATGRVFLREPEPTADVRVAWQDFRIPAELAGQPLATRGALDFDGGASDFRAEGRFAIGPPKRLADVVLRAQGSRERVVLQQFDVTQRAGRLAATGVLNLQPALAWDLKATADDFDPGELLVDWKGRLDLALTTAGRMREDTGPTGTLQLERLQGRLRGRSLSGRGDLAFSLPERLAGELQLRSGRSRVALTARQGESLDARATFAVESFDDFVPGARGRLDGNLRAQGDWPALTIRGSVDVRDAGLAGASVRSVVADVNVRNPLEPSGRVDVRASGIESGEVRVAELTAQASGAAGEHRFALDARGEPFDARVRLTGALDGTAWTGTVGELALRVADAARLQLRDPVRVAWNDGALDVSQACFEDGALGLCAEVALEQNGALQAAYDLRNVPLSLANALAPDALPGELSGTVRGAGRVRRTEAGLWYGDAALNSDRAAIQWGTKAPGALVGEELLIYSDLAIGAQLRGTRVDGQLSAGTAGDGKVQVNVGLDGIDGAAPALRGDLQADLPTLAPLAPFVPQLDELTGRIAARGTLAGTLPEPRIQADVRATELGAELPLLGLRLQNGEFTVDAQPEGDMRLAGGIQSGDGRLRLEGTATRDGELRATIAGENLLAADLPAARVIAAPDLRLVRTAEQMTLTGRVAIPTANVNLQRLPQLVPKARARVSPDVVIVNEPPREAVAEEAGVPFVARVQVALGEDVELTGFGLNANVEGDLVVVERPARPTVGSGEIRVAGTYKAFGQDLTIEQGRALFAGTPLDNPRLDITAVRNVDDVAAGDRITAGLRITGTGRDPQVAVFSDPTLGETEALAYLVTGRPLSSIGTGGSGEGDLLGNAAQSLGTAAGGLLAKRLGKSLGVDEVAVTDNEDIGGAAFTVGQYLSPRLYLGYGVGLFEPGQVVTIRYALSEALSIEAVRAESATRAGIEYRIER